MIGDSDLTTKYVILTSFLAPVFQTQYWVMFGKWGNRYCLSLLIAVGNIWLDYLYIYNTHVVKCVGVGHGDLYLGRCKGHGPEETSLIFLLRGTGIVLVLFYIYPIVPYAPAFLHSFLLLVTVVKGIGLKRHLYFYSLVLEIFSYYSVPIR